MKHAFDFEYAEIHLIAIFIKKCFIINTKTFICKNALDLKHKVNLFGKFQNYFIAKI